MAKRGNNEGSIFKKKNGKWRAQVSINGRRLSRTASTRAECHDWLRKKLDQIDKRLTFEEEKCCSRFSEHNAVDLHFPPPRPASRDVLG